MIIDTKKIADVVTKALRAAATAGWKDINKVKPADELPVMFGLYFIDPDPNGYHGGDRWQWQASGVLSEGVYYIDYGDEICSNQYSQTITHWKELDDAPPSAKMDNP